MYNYYCDNYHFKIDGRGEDSHNTRVLVLLVIVIPGGVILIGIVVILFILVCWKINSKSEIYELNVTFKQKIIITFAAIYRERNQVLYVQL